MYLFIHTILLKYTIFMFDRLISPFLSFNMENVQWSKSEHPSRAGETDDHVHEDVIQSTVPEKGNLSQMSQMNCCASICQNFGKRCCNSKYAGQDTCRCCLALIDGVCVIL